MFEQLKLSIQQASPGINMPIKIVSIDGYGGSGKTVLAKKLAKELNAETLHTDDFATWDNPLDWWPRLVDEVLKPIKSGDRKISYKRSAWYKNHNPKPTINQNITPIMILEGVSSIRKEFRPYLAYAVWIETPKEICMERGIARDLAGNPDNKSLKQIQQDWDRWHSYEEEYVKRDKPREYANIIIDGTKG